MKIKICGLRRKEDIAYANEVKPDFIGFILSPGYRRSIDLETAKALKADLQPSVKAVGVFVNEDPEYIVEYVKKGIIDMIQLHGSESNEDIRRLRDMTGVPIIKMFKPESPEILKEAEASEADLVLFDSGAGSGKTFDWDIVKDFKRDFFLAGGITPEMIPEIRKRLNPYAVDLSSGVETDGVKDLKKMKSAIGDRG